MATKYYYFTGKAQWSKVYPGQEDEEYDAFSIDVALDDWDNFTKSGLQLVVRESGKPNKNGNPYKWYTGEDGIKYTSFRRKVHQLINGETVDFGEPKVLDKENHPFNKPIGNGSTVTVKVAVYDTRKGKGHRLETVRVEDWIEYKPEASDNAGGTVPKMPF
jgi:hypothetical protein